MSDGIPTLLFFTTPTSGPARRMESLLAHLARKERGRLRVTRVDCDTQPKLRAALEIREIPTLVLLVEGTDVARIEGRASAPEIERLLAPHLAHAA